MLQFAIRLACLEDDEAIHDMTRRAFAPMTFAGGDEQNLAREMRAAGALELSLVAEQNGAVIGHAAFSPATNADGSTRWFALGPIAVEPAHQRKGAGTALIAEGFKLLRLRGAAGCIVIGDTGYYPRHGFVPSPALAPVAEPAEYFMVAGFGGIEPQGRFAFHPVFYGNRNAPPK